MKSSKLAIIGSGSVGSTCAYACILLKSVASIIMCTLVKNKAEVADLSDAAFITNSTISTGTLKEAGGCDIICVTAGAKQRPGESRIDLIDRNYKILSSVINDMQPINPNAIILIVANPVDVLTFVAQKISGLPKNQVIGSGTFLDSQRLRLELSKVLNISETSIHANVLGEHGDSQFVAWSSANISGIPLLSFDAVKLIDRIKMAQEVKTKAYSIINAKGSTYYGIGGCVSQIVKAILQNTKQVMPISHYIESLGCCLSLPAVIGRVGVIETLMPALDEEGKLALEKSANELIKAINGY